MGSEYPIRIQSMTTADTMDTKKSVEETIALVESGCDYVRLTAPSIKEAQNLEKIRKEVRTRGYDVPLVADIHFTPNAAELAARIVEKVRVNPGNYADKKKFEIIEYNDSSYNAELDRIREKFIPLVNICKEYGTAMRIGTNHGSLSDRIMSRYGDTPIGMVESALEFIRICEEFNYHELVISMKASNTQVMVQAYRLLVQKLDEEGLKPYPLHLGVTEAGDGEDGRVKSAVGIGTLLEDGLGDTVRVSLTEDAIHEAPVAKSLVDRYTNRQETQSIPSISYEASKSPYEYAKKASSETLTIGKNNVPRVISDLSNLEEINMKALSAVGHFYLPEPDKWTMNDHGTDFIYTGLNPLPFMAPNGLIELVDVDVWKRGNTNQYPVLSNISQAQALKAASDTPFALILDTEEVMHDEAMALLKETAQVILVLKTNNTHAMPALRNAFYHLMEKGITHPIIIKRDYQHVSKDELQLYAATDIGGLLIEGFGDGVWLTINQNDKEESIKTANTLSFGILQAARTRMTKTEYISCPSCGRTLFDLQDTTAMIRSKTDHLKGVKIGIMGCIVNGPGEMADADYGYVGSGKGKITLYRGQEVVKRGVDSEYAVDELIGIIKEDGNWIEKI